MWICGTRAAQEIHAKPQLQNVSVVVLDGDVFFNVKIKIMY
jgi:hypothetical protein